MRLLRDHPLGSPPERPEIVDSIFSMTATTDETIGSPEFCRRTGITYRQLDYWCRNGYIVPAVRANGSGTRRRFDIAETRVARAVGEFGARHVLDRVDRYRSGVVSEIDRRVPPVVRIAAAASPDADVFIVRTRDDVTWWRTPAEAIAWGDQSGSAFQVLRV